jgi:WD40 repeat protein
VPSPKEDRNFATCSWDKRIQIYDVATGMYRQKGPKTLENGHEGSISCCYLSKDNSLCVSGGYDSRVILWDIFHCKMKLALRGHLDWINDITLTDDNKWIISVDKDKQIQQWEITNVDKIRLVIEQNKNLGHKLVKVSYYSHFLKRWVMV